MEYIYATSQINFFLTKKGKEKLKQIKKRMCDEYCRYPKEAKMNGDIIIDDLVECPNFPLNELDDFLKTKKGEHR